MKTYSARLWEPLDVQIRINDAKSINPFDIEVWAHFKRDDGEILHVPAFYAGGDRWIARFLGVESGEWEYTIDCRTATTSPGEGVVVVDGSSPRGRGRLRVAANTPHRLEWESGEDYFLIGFEADWLGVVAQAERGIDKARQLIDEIALNGFNHVVMNVYAHDVLWPGHLGRKTDFDFSNPDRWPFGGSNANPDYEVLDTDYFDRLDEIIAYMNEKGIICHLMLYVWNKKVNWPEQDSSADKRYVDYVVARYQGYPNVVWDVSKEALTYGYCTGDYIAGKCRRIRERDAFGHLLTVHDKEFCVRHPELIDLISVQDWRSELYEYMIRFYEEFSDKPVLNIEHGGYERSPFINAPGDYDDPATCLKRNYLCAFAGVYSTYYWQGSSWNIVCYDIHSLPHEKRPHLEYFRHMQKFFSDHPFDELKPVPVGKLTSSGFVLRSDDGQLLVLKPEDSYRLHLRGQGNREPLRISWFNPLTGVESEPEVVPAGNFVDLYSPFSGQFSIAIITPESRESERV